MTKRLGILAILTLTLAALAPAAALAADHPSNRADIIVGTSGDDVINSKGGRDIMHGRRGVDTLNGGEGDDKLTGGRGADFLFGDAGNDLIRSHSDKSIDTIDCGAGEADVAVVDVTDIVVPGTCETIRVVRP